MMRALLCVIGGILKFLIRNLLCVRKCWIAVFWAVRDVHAHKAPADRRKKQTGQKKPDSLGVKISGWTRTPKLLICNIEKKAG